MQLSGRGSSNLQKLRFNPSDFGEKKYNIFMKIIFSTYQFLSIVLSAFHTLFNFISKITCETNIYIPGFPLLSKLVFRWPVHLVCLLLTKWTRILYWDYTHKGLFVVVLNLYWITNSLGNSITAEVLDPLEDIFGKESLLDQGQISLTIFIVSGSLRRSKNILNTAQRVFQS